MIVLIPALLAVAVAGTPVVPVVKKANDRLVCKSEARTGTRFTTRICKTKDEWEAISEQNIRDAHDMINRPVIETRRD